MNNDFGNVSFPIKFLKCMEILFSLLLIVKMFMHQKKSQYFDFGGMSSSLKHSIREWVTKTRISTFSTVI